MRGIRESLRQLWEKVDRRAKKDQFEALQKRVGNLELRLAKLEAEKEAQ